LRLRKEFGLFANLRPAITDLRPAILPVVLVSNRVILLADDCHHSPASGLAYPAGVNPSLDTTLLDPPLRRNTSPGRQKDKSRRRQHRKNKGR
jgi:hypothetical protein